MATDTNGLIWFYGDYDHEPGEVYPAKIEQQMQISDRGVRWANRYRFTVSGSFVGQNPEMTPTDVNNKIAEIEAEYLHDYKDCGFKLSDGSPTEHYMTSDDSFNLSGNKIVSRSWDNQTPTEFANTRSFSITIESLWMQSYNEILHFSESTKRIGDGGQIWVLHNNWGEDPYKEETNSKSKVFHVQSGRIVALSGYVSPPAPYWPADEMTWKQEVTQTSPTYHGDLSFTKGTHYVTEYKYFFERVGLEYKPPNPWYPS